MPNTATIYLPTSTWVHVRACTNAALEQQVTLAYENGTQTQLTGSGEQDTVMAGGDFGITTPARSSSSLGYRVVVTVNTWLDDTWQASQVLQGVQSIMYYSLAMVVSEDYVDGDWNDAIVQFGWWTPPSARNLADYPLLAGRRTASTSAADTAPAD